MTTNEIKTEVIQLISELFKGKGFNTDIIEYADLVDDIGMDSIIFISIVVELETKFVIEVPEDMLLMENFKTINDIVSVVENELAFKAVKSEENIDDKT